ncbi:mechanosensitive ion channel family protein [Pedobacter sp. BG31]|uniref:mechanosensitive ion channel family protein n=1 Tax=Pedobacter sp. BG31 TaxID=3349697 RepID=UPI0035F36AE3
MKSNVIWIAMLFGCLAFANPMSAQSPSGSVNITDSSIVKTKTFLDKMQEFAKKSAKESTDDFEADKVAMAQLKVISEIRLTIEEAKGYLKRGIDTFSMYSKITTLKSNFQIASDGVLINTGSTQTYRNLASTKRILRELLIDAKKVRNVLEKKQKEITFYHYKIDSLSTAKELFVFPKDSVQTMDYLRTLATAAVDVGPVDSTLKTANFRVQKLLNNYSLLISQLQNGIEQVENFERIMANSTTGREIPNLWQKQLKSRPISEIIRFSLSKNMLTLRFYLSNNAGKLALIVFLTILSFTYLNALRRIYISKGLIKNEFNGQLAIRYPALSAVLIVLSLFQFLLISPPFLLSFIIWLICCICLSIIFFKFITSYWMKVWLTMVGFFILASGGNILLQASRQERWYMITISILGALAGIFILKQKRNLELREKWISISIFIMVGLEVLSTVLNLYGRYNLSKTIFVVGFLNIIIAILFLWVVRLINEGLLLSFDVYTVQDRKLFYLNFGKVGNRAPSILYVLIVLGWLILMGHNFPLFEYLLKPVLDFFISERTIGNYTFSINGLLLFFGIMSISVIISKIVSFFTSDDHLVGSKAENQNNRGLGSWVLLLRISILTIGLFLSIAAAGIPMERITIVIGALGVGIGFGLQTLVNNLVSGLIIAFEKPVNVGDIVDIDGQGGTMKSIGFRSSVITTWEGGDLVMPNGDLLNSHLMNWSLSGNRRRLSITIGIDYGTDLQKCREIIISILEKEDRVLKTPKPAVNFELFNTNSVDLKIQIWTRHLQDNNPTRNDLLIAIHRAFNNEGIKIPVNQQEVYLHEMNKPLARVNGDEPGDA